jgi:hypothetical protein
MSSKKNLTSGALKIGFSTTTCIPLFTLLCLCRHFWPIMTWLFACTLCIPQIRHPVTSLPCTKTRHWREEYFMTPTQFKHNHRIHLQSSEETMLANTSNNGAVTGFAVPSDKCLLWRCQHCIRSKFCYHWQKNIVLTHSDQPSYTIFSSYPLYFLKYITCTIKMQILWCVRFSTNLAIQTVCSFPVS